MKMERVLLVAEIGINHSGDLEIAKRLIDVAHAAGCDYVKFQKRTVELVYTKEELDRYRESPWGTTTREQKYGIEFDEADYDFIDEYCRQVGIGWYASPWDVGAVKFLERYDMPYVKIPSALVTNKELLGAIKKMNKPVIISTGMSTEKEIKNSIDLLGDDMVEYILACTSTYPTVDYEMNLNFVTTLIEEFEPMYKVGFSNHSPGIVYMLCAVALGARMLEFHVTRDRASYGSDQAASIEPEGVFKIAKHVRHLEVAMNSGKWKVYESEEKIKEKLRK